jgi:hypothetical protein
MWPDRDSLRTRAMDSTYTMRQSKMPSSLQDRQAGRKAGDGDVGGGGGGSIDSMTEMADIPIVWCLNLM